MARNTGIPSITVARPPTTPRATIRICQNPLRIPQKQDAQQAGLVLPARVGYWLAFGEITEFSMFSYTK
jgi:hypothetical protein